MICPICACCEFRTVSQLLSHIRISHADAKDFSIQCTLQNCCRTYKSFTTYRNHVYDFHGIGQLDPTDDFSSSHSVLSGESPDESLRCTNHISESIPEQSSSSEVITPSDLQKAAATWILKSREKHKLPLSVMDTLIADIQSLYDVSLSCIASRVSAIVQQAEIDIQTAELIMTELNGRSSSTCSNIFRGLSTQAQQMHYFRTNFGLVEPVEVVLGSKVSPSFHGSKRRLVEKNETMVYIPLLKTLEVLLNNDGVLTEIEQGHQQRHVGILSDFCDGDYCLNHELFSTDHKAIQLLFYYDDVEMCNPLGSSRTKHKQGLFYFTLGNLHPKHRSRMCNIYLAAICRHKYIKKYSINEVLKPIMKDVKKLENGVTMSLQGVQTVVHGAIALLSADNLASSACGGFKEGSTAYRYCRQCMATIDQTKTIFKEEDVQLRSTDSHIAHLEELKDDDGTKSTQYGVNCRSVLMDLQYFDVCQCLVPDVMHDILEGSLQYELKLLLKHFILDRSYFSLGTLNDIIEGIELGYMELDRPAPISLATLTNDTNSLKQKAIQSWALCKLIPIMVGRFIPDGDEHWANYTLMLEITDYLMAPQLCEDDIGYLKVQIEDHHTTFRQLYPTSSVIPKMHYMIHMPRLIFQFGPLVRQWTMRFEAKHSYFKKVVQSIGNFKNLSLTLGKRHQLMSCYNNLDRNSISQENLDIGPGKSIAELDRPQELKESSECFRPNWIVLNGIKYKPDAVIMTGISEDFPVFVKLLHLYLVDHTKLFAYGHLLKTLFFNRHYHCFVVKPTNEFKLFCLEEVCDFHYQLYFLRKLKTDYIIIPKYHICGTVYYSEFVC